MSMSKQFFLFLMLFVLAVPSVLAASEQATFASFYDPSSHLGWLAITGGVIFAIGAGAAVFFSGGAATPGVAAVGSWIGSSVLGFSGVAATNAGLALLGGGSLAAGGFGMAGGAAVISAAFAFSTGVVVDVTVNSVSSHYEQKGFYENARKHMVYLPVDKIASISYSPAKKALESLEKINKTELLSAADNQIILTSSLKNLDDLSTDGEPGQLIRAHTLKALLEFDTQDFTKAKSSAENAINRARKQSIRRTMPAFIYAASSTADENFKNEFNAITSNYFSYSILAEPENKLIPLLFGAYLNLVSMRFSKDTLDNSDWVSSITSVADKMEDNDIKKSVYKILISNYFILLKSKQQFIYAVTDSHDAKILASKRTPLALDAALSGYKTILHNIYNLVMKSNLLNNDDSISNYILLYKQYDNDKKALVQAVEKYKERTNNNSGIGA